MSELEEQRAKFRENMERIKLGGYKVANKVLTPNSADEPPRPETGGSIAGKLIVASIVIFFVLLLLFTVVIPRDWPRV